MKALTASEARRTLFTLIEEAVELEEEIYITSRKGTAVLISESEYRGLRIAVELFRDPVGGLQLLESMKQSRERNVIGPMTMDELRERIEGM